jgi:hypothetical protein
MNKYFNAPLLLTYVCSLILTIAYDIVFPLYFFLIAIITFICLFFRFFRLVSIANQLKVIIVSNGDEEKYQPYRKIQFNHYIFFSGIEYPNNSLWNENKIEYLNMVDLNKKLVVFCVLNFLSFSFFMYIYSI